MSSNYGFDFGEHFGELVKSAHARVKKAASYPMKGTVVEVRTRACEEGSRRSENHGDL